MTPAPSAEAPAFPHRIELTGAANVRDLGGYVGRDGRRVRSGVIYRADSLHRLTDDDVARLAELGLRTVVDLRSDEEVNKSGTPVAHRIGADYVHKEIRHGKRRPREEGPERSLVDELRDLNLPDVYKKYLSVNGPELEIVLRLLGRPEASPVLFHCFAGKDRTGILAALVLKLLGVSDADVAEDYAATAVTFERFLALVESDDPPILDTDRMNGLDPSFLEAKAETMVDLLDWIHTEHGSVEALVEPWGIGPEVVEGLRTHLLEQ